MTCQFLPRTLALARPRSHARTSTPAGWIRSEYAAQRATNVQPNVLTLASLTPPCRVRDPLQFFVLSDFFASSRLCERYGLCDSA